MICNNCKLEKEKFYAKNKVCAECFRTRRYAHRRNNPKLTLLVSARCRAKSEKVPFDLKETDFEIPEFCPVLGLKLGFNFGRGGFRENSPTLDKFIPELGYVKDNVQILSFRANRLKGDASIEEVEKLLLWMQKKSSLNMSIKKAGCNLCSKGTDNGSGQQIGDSSGTP